MNHDSYNTEYIRAILQDTKTIALVGASSNIVRPSYFVMKYLLDKGYDVTPVNPGLAGQELLGRKVFGTLSDIPYPIDMVDIFRNAEAVRQIVDEALALPVKPKVIWMQLGVRNDDAARAGRGGGNAGGHEPLPEDGVRQAVGRMGVGGRQLRHHLVEATYDACQRQGAEPGAGSEALLKSSRLPVKLRRAKVSASVHLGENHGRQNPRI